MSLSASSILIVDDDPIVVDSMAEYLAGLGYLTATARGGAEALQMIRDAETPSGGRPPRPFAVLVTDVSMPDIDGLELIRTVRKSHRDIVPVVITGYGTIEAAVKAIRVGAIDYLTKPLVDEELRIAVEKALQQHALLAENENLRSQLDQRYGLDNIVGADERMRRIYGVVEAVAPSKTTVLMCGESGTGKSLIARAIHRQSPRASGPFVEISCGSIPETLLESELFGHQRGAFTGAHADKPGKFLTAHGGTLFLDEINSASPGMQLKLLRVLQERSFEPVGSNETIEVDVRVILASNQPLEDLVANGDFRQDLYYRINVVMIQLPPLRERIADIPLLAAHFLDKKSSEAGKQVTGFTDEATAALQGYLFPGNVRELENIVERAVVLTRATRIDVADLPPNVIDNSTGRLLPQVPGVLSPDGPYRPMPLREALEEPEKQIILTALEANEWNRQQTADDLGINRTTLYKKIKQYGLEALGRAG
ncbi:MAG: sigma-54-dependent Fis family transcriptional regulator [Phycisphaerales bacterium]|nr:sigma-54 dependent transcriptional regulator [Phycisphaerae bacterium]NNF43501.1 sigma-54-dependent Fis family transcriptional regulator [Phycisphaerales bacterium]NNM26831.1 sigma-54-dependent Fis family transcriptional regulator [Phycisphaerales bacterium]